MKPAALEYLFQLPMIDLAGPEFWKFFDDAHLSRYRNVRQAAHSNRNPNLFDLQPRLIRGGDERFAFILVGPADHRNLEAQSVMRECAGQNLFTSGKADHFAANFGEAFHSAFNEEKSLLVNSHDVAGVIPAAKGLESCVGVIVQ